MILRPGGYVDLPAHRGPGGFDHAAVDRKSGRLYVAHTSNDALDIIDLRANRYEGSIDALTGVAGALVDEQSGLVFTSNRGEDSVAIIHPDHPVDAAKVQVGRRPNGLAFDAGRGTLLAANIGDPPDQSSPTLSLVDVERAALVASIPLPGRPRWAVFDARSDAYFVNIAEPAVIAVVAGADPSRVAREIVIPAAGPHGLDIDDDGSLLCAADAGQLIRLDRDGRAVAEGPLSGAPDVLFIDHQLRLVFVAVGNPGSIDVLDADTLAPIESVATEQGAHTIGFAADHHRVYAFLPGTHRAAVFQASRTHGG